jgi:hypothetical protein
MNRMLATAAVLATVVITSATALAEPGKNGPPGPEGNPNADPVESGMAASSTGTSSPGNSGNNPHGGAPGAVGHSQPPASDNAASSSSSAVPVGGPTASTAEPAEAPEAHGNGNGNGPADKITICHATHSETNPYVVITVSENSVSGNGHGRPGHQEDEDVIPAGSDGSCPATVREEPPPDDGDGGNEGKDDQGVLGKSGGGPGDAGPSGAGPSGDGPSGDVRGSLPFTGMLVGLLLAVGVGALSGGVGLRRIAGGDADDSDELPGLSRRRAQVTGQASAWADSIAARSTALGERAATLERSLPE